MMDKLGEDKQFIEIINTGTDEKPYYEIKYLDRVTGITHIGYSSYKLDVLSEFLREDFGYDRRCKGHWIETDPDDPIWWKCSNCNRLSDFADNFCPNCGCRMVEPQERSDKE